MTLSGTRLTSIDTVTDASHPRQARRRRLAGLLLRAQSDERLVALAREGTSRLRGDRPPLRQAAGPLRGGDRLRPTAPRTSSRTRFSKAYWPCAGDRPDRAAAVAVPDRPQHGAQRPPRPAARTRSSTRDSTASSSRPRPPSAARRSNELVVALEALPDAQREAIVMRELEGRPRGDRRGAGHHARRRPPADLPRARHAARRRRRC